MNLYSRRRDEGKEVSPEMSTVSAFEERRRTGRIGHAGSRSSWRRGVSSAHESFPSAHKAFQALLL